jgi:hypothetical protein
MAQVRLGGVSRSRIGSVAPGSPRSGWSRVPDPSRAGQESTRFPRPPGSGNAVLGEVGRRFPMTAATSVAHGRTCLLRRPSSHGHRNCGYRQQHAYHSGRSMRSNLVSSSFNFRARPFPVVAIAGYRLQQQPRRRRPGRGEAVMISAFFTHWKLGIKSGAI